MATILYTEDILHNGFEQRTIPLQDDYEGVVLATLIRRLSKNTTKAVLYIHGFNDYFFQAEIALLFNDKAVNFYALDLRRYGRSCLPHQKFNDVRNVRTYYEEIQSALHIMRNEGNEDITLFGHSTGGLILTLFAKDHSGKGLYDRIILNSPFFEFNQSLLVKKCLPLAACLGKLFPALTVAGGFSEEYGKSIHKAYYGEWDYNLDWKPNIAPKVNLGWIRAIYTAQQELQYPFSIKEPVLVMHSHKSATNVKDRVQSQTHDVILNVDDIDKIAHNIIGDVSIVPIEGAVHDLVLSLPSVRTKVYDTMFRWMQ